MIFSKHFIKIIVNYASNIIPKIYQVYFKFRCQFFTSEISISLLFRGLVNQRWQVFINSLFLLQLNDSSAHIFVGSLFPISFLTPAAAVPGLATALTNLQLTVTKAHSTQQHSVIVPTLDVFDAYLHCWRHRYQMKRDGMTFDRIYDNIVQCLS